MFKTSNLKLGSISVQFIRKPVQHVHLSVYPPKGKVSLIAPFSTRTEVARAYAISKLSWIKKQRIKFEKQARETPRKFINGESYYLWGKRYILQIYYTNKKPYVQLSHKYIDLFIKKKSNKITRMKIINKWQKLFMEKFILSLIKKWEKKLCLKVNNFYIRKMKTKWGSCKHSLKNILINIELIRKPKDLVEYVLVHEMIHLIEPSHNNNFIALLDKHYPSWKEARSELNSLPLSYEIWR